MRKAFAQEQHESEPPKRQEILLGCYHYLGGLLSASATCGVDNS